MHRPAPTPSQVLLLVAALVVTLPFVFAMSLVQWWRTWRVRRYLRRLEREAYREWQATRGPR